MEAPCYWGMQLQIARAGRSGAFDHTKDVVGSKTACKMLCFTIETTVVGREGRMC